MPEQQLTPYVEAEMAASGIPTRRLPGLPSHYLPWTDPHSVTTAQITSHIVALEQALIRNPRSSELCTCLGIAHAMNFDVYRSMDALEKAVHLDARSFIAQFKYAELMYRLRVAIRAEKEAVHAAELAQNATELVMAQRLLGEIRKSMREGTQKPEWSRPLLAPALFVLGLVVLFSLAYTLSYYLKL